MEPNGQPKVEDPSDGPGGSKDGGKQDAKPLLKTTSRVPRACNACRKQKMRCEGADDPPCRRCKHGNLVCLFEKPTREASLTGEAGLERFKNLEAQVTEIQQTQNAVLASLDNITAYLRTGTFQQRSPSAYPPFCHQSPQSSSIASPATPTPSSSHSAQMGDPRVVEAPGNYADSRSGSLPMSDSAQLRQPYPRIYRSLPSLVKGGIPSGPANFNPAQIKPSTYSQSSQIHSNHQPIPQHSPSLPPFSGVHMAGPPQHLGPVQPRYQEPHVLKRKAPPATDSAHSSDVEEDLPSSGLIAPWEILRVLSDAATKRAATENGRLKRDDPQIQSLGEQSGEQSRPTKRTKVKRKAPQLPDVVTKGIISEAEAKELFRIFFLGCSTFLPVFNSKTDTFDSLRPRSTFAVNSICMVAARTRDAGGPRSVTFTRCLEEAQAMACATMFSSDTQPEEVQAMILVSGWSNNGWASGGHAVRLAIGLSMNTAWPKLFERMKAGKHETNADEDRDLVIRTRIWFCLYLFEHQMSYGTGRAAIMKDDESIYGCRLFLQHPLAIEDDMRLVSTVELMVLREKVHNRIQPLPRPLDDGAFQILHDASVEFATWYLTWDDAFSQKYEDAAFYRQSLRNQQLHAELFHNATALTNIMGPEDVQNMPPAQRELAVRSIQIAQQGLQTTISPTSYREGMRFAVTYTHVAATFTASFLLRLARLFPDECNMQEIRGQVEELANLMATVPAGRYALTLRWMLKKGEERRLSAPSIAPPANQLPPQDVPPRQPVATQMGHPVGMPVPHELPHQYYTHYGEPSSVPAQHMSTLPNDTQVNHAMGTYVPGSQVESERFLGNFDTISMEQVPEWLRNQSLGGSSFSQNGMETFVMPTDYMNGHQVW